MVNRWKGWLGVTTVIIILLDQLTKYILELEKPSSGIISYTQNTGAGFGILPGQTIILGVISTVVAILIIAYYPKIPSERFPLWCWGMFLGGVIGNLIDRLVRGYVVDFINIGFWPAFNIADSAITIGAMGLLIYYWKK